MNETTENFWAAWALPLDLPKPVFYRLYYDDNGNFLFYSMEDIPGNYIEIDHATFTASSPRVYVKNGKLYHIKTNVATKLVPSNQGQACDPRDVTVVINKQPAQYWELKATNETD